MSNAEHFRRLERLYHSAPTNRYYEPRIEVGDGVAEVSLTIKPDFLHAAAAVHGSVYFKLLDDAAFFAANSRVEGVFVLTASFNLHFLRPVSTGRLRARGRLVNASRRLLVAESELFDEDDRLLARGSGTFMPSELDLEEWDRAAAP
ncbi:MAG: PaaI family thioesterase [Thermoanaerobaculia bacterium]|nr:PaaI family thioesterase [Thermoanaerobaculia bacterium]